MDFSFTQEQEAIRANVGKICARFDDDYWLRKDREGGFPADFFRAFAGDTGSASAFPRNLAARGWG